MRTPRRSILALAGLLFTFLLTSQYALAIKSMNCPKEPATNTPIASGDVYAGDNCELYTAGDVDSFVFNANDGDTWQIIVGFQGGYGTCMALYDPNGKAIFPSTCTGTGQVFDSQTLTVTGQYTIILKMGGNGTSADYALSLERINPVPPDAQSVALKQAVAGTLSPPTAQQAYTFTGATTGTYEVSVSFTGGYGTCIYLYYPGSGTPQPAPDQGCTGTGTVQFTFVPPQNGTYMALLYTGGDGTGTYSFEVSCYLGTCTPPPPPTTCADNATYNATTGILTMNFTLATPIAVTWNAWLADENAMQTLWSQSQPITEPQITVIKTQTVAKSGKVGILSTFTTPKKGITCSSWVKVSTGTP